jgi:hypothetical protein
VTRRTTGCPRRCPATRGDRGLRPAPLPSMMMATCLGASPRSSFARRSSMAAKSPPTPPRIRSRRREGHTLSSRAVGQQPLSGPWARIAAMYNAPAPAGGPRLVSPAASRVPARGPRPSQRY